MLLTFDIGNTNIKSALFDENNLIEFIIHSDVDETVKYLNTKLFTDTAICSVNPSVEKTLSDNISKKGIPIFRTNIRNRFNLKIKYETPDTLGMDRVCSAAGAFEIATKNKLIVKNQYLLTIDFGTATTINVVSPESSFIGGMITPGIITMLKSLNEKTAQLPLPEVSSYKGVIGNSTNSSIISGVITATIGMINETVNQIRADSNQILPLIFATGGNARFIIPYIKHKIYFEEALVLKGLKVIYDLNKIKPG
jgi:type III pantothenate kinase